MRGSQPRPIRGHIFRLVLSALVGAPCTVYHARMLGKRQILRKPPDCSTEDAQTRPVGRQAAALRAMQRDLVCELFVDRARQDGDSLTTAWGGGARQTRLRAPSPGPRSRISGARSPSSACMDRRGSCTAGSPAAVTSSAPRSRRRRASRSAAAAAAAASVRSLPTRPREIVKQFQQLLFLFRPYTKASSQSVADTCKIQCEPQSSHPRGSRHIT